MLIYIIKSRNYMSTGRETRDKYILILFRSVVTFSAEDINNVT